MIKIIADSGCDFTQQMKQEKEIKQVPLTVQLGDKVYIDDLTLDINNFVQEMMKFKSSRKTAAPSPEKFMLQYGGSESVFVVTLSSKLSGSYNSAAVAKNMYIEEHGEKTINIIDSKSASVGETLIALRLSELSKKGLSDKDILKDITEYRDKLKTYFILECYDSLVSTGRLNSYVAKIASMLSIVPICTAVDGETSLKEKVRGNKKAFSKLIDIMLQEGEDFENKTLGITHVNCYDKALLLKSEILKKISFKSVLIVQASGLCSNYADNNGLVIAF